MRGVMVKSAEARQYVQEVGLVARSKGYRPKEGDVKITLDFYRPRKAGDLDNRIKIVLDGLQGTAFINDSQIVEIHARRHDDARNPRVEMQIEYLAAA
jgi:crossover junction endodeoxyribonuclease RusA